MSNYPPGVTGMEPEICGSYNFSCPTCESIWDDNECEVIDIGDDDSYPMEQTKLICPSCGADLEENY